LSHLKKGKLYQTKIRLLGYDIYQGSITSISIAIELVAKFSNEIKDKTQLQRFMRYLNYILDFLYKRLKKNPHT
jgi:hypothetical protein